MTPIGAWELWKPRELDERGALLAFRLVLGLHLLFMLLYDPASEQSPSMLPFALILLQLASNAALAWLRAEDLRRGGTQAGIFLFDMGVVSATLCAAREPSDLFLAYFLVIFMSAMLSRMEQGFLIGAVAGACYLALESNGKGAGSLLAPHVLLRFPFFFSAAFLSSFLSQQIRRRDRELLEHRKAKEDMRRAYSRLEEAQARFMHTEKLAAVGLLASGVAHELNNPLTSILGFSQLLLKEEGLDPRLREDIESIHAQTRRCAKITRGLLDFAREKPPQRCLVRVPSVLEEILALARHELALARIMVSLEAPDSLPPVLGDPAELQQAFLNLITNARQALEGRPAPRLAISAAAEGDNVLVRFEDNGNGIPGDLLGRIFEPFFTTKPLGQGTGLGLPIAHGIARRHGGRVTVESREGEGSVFTMELPAAKKEEDHGNE